MRDVTHVSFLILVTLVTSIRRTCTVSAVEVPSAVLTGATCFSELTQTTAALVSCVEASTDRTFRRNLAPSLAAVIYWTLLQSSTAKLLEHETWSKTSLFSSLFAENSANWPRPLRCKCPQLDTAVTVTMRPVNIPNTSSVYCPISTAVNSVYISQA